MSARASIAGEMRQLLRDRRRALAQLDDVVEQRAELMTNPKVARYVHLHAQEQVRRDELTGIERRIVELVAIQEEVP